MITKENTSFDSTHFLLFMWKWRKTLIVITAIAAVSSAVIAMMIPSKFKSTVTLFPTTTSSISKALLSDNPGANNDILQFGEEEEAEQMIQVLTSDDIMWRVTDKYKLMSHYRIDSTSEFRKTFLVREFQSNVKIQRTEYMSVEIHVMDEDPQYAANIANDIADLYDSTK